MATVIASDLAALYELGYAANPASPNTIYRLFFNSLVGKIYIVDADFNILYERSGNAGSGLKVSLSDLCAINDFGENARNSNPNAIWRMYFYVNRSLGESNYGVILANQSFDNVWYFDMTSAMVLNPISASDICVIQDFGLNAQLSSPNAIWRTYLHIGTDPQEDPTTFSLVNRDFQVVASFNLA